MGIGFASRPVHPKEAGEVRLGLFECNIRQRLAGIAHDAMFSVIRVRDASYGTLLHVAFNAIVGHCDALAIVGLECATVLSVAGEACGTVGCFFLSRLGFMMD